MNMEVENDSSSLEESLHNNCMRSGFADVSCMRTADSSCRRARHEGINFSMQREQDKPLYNLGPQLLGSLS